MEQTRCQKLSASFLPELVCRLEGDLGPGLDSISPASIINKHVITANLIKSFIDRPEMSRCLTGTLHFVRGWLKQPILALQSEISTPMPCKIGVHVVVKFRTFET